MNPNTIEIEGTTIEEQTERVLKNLSIVLAGAKSTLKDIVKTNVYLKNMAMITSRCAQREGHMS